MTALKYYIPFLVMSLTTLSMIINHWLSILFISVRIRYLNYIGVFFGEGNGNPLQYSCLENLMDGGAWEAAVHEVTKSWTRLSDFTFTLHLHALEKEMATHSSVPAWKITWIGEPGGLPSLGSHRVGHDWSDTAAAAAAPAAKYFYFKKDQEELI